MSSISVGTSSGLYAALNVAKSGDVIYLATGIYSGIDVRGLKAGGVTITSADAAKPAVITDLNIINSSGLTFSKLEFAPKEGGFFSYTVDGSSNITFTNLNVHGSMNGNPQGDSSGISVLNSSGVRILNSEFQQLERGVGIGQSSNVEISGNNFHDLRVTGVVVSSTSGIKIDGNEFKNFFPKAGDHPDAIQFMTTGTVRGSENIVVSNNLISRGTGDSVQGIFIRDEAGSLAYKNVTISGNLLVGTGYNGIGVFHAENLKLIGNQLISYEGPTNANWVLVQDANGVLAEGNTALKFGFDNVSGLVQNGNVANAAVADGGAVALQAWAKLHGGMEGLLPSQPLEPPVAERPVIPELPVVPDLPVVPQLPATPSDVVSSETHTLNATVQNLTLTGSGNVNGAGNDLNNIISGNSGKNYLSGGAGNDTISGGAGSDTMVGGSGDDVYFVSGTRTNGEDLVIEKAAQGIDTVVVTSMINSYTLSSNVEVLIQTGNGGVTGIGNELNNTIFGNSGANMLFGLGGDDALNGGEGDDVLAGGQGSDVLRGGAGNDTFWFQRGDGRDVITDFGANGAHDQLDFSYYYQVGMKPVLTDIGNDLVVSFGNGDAVTLIGVHASELTATTKGFVI